MPETTPVALKDLALDLTNFRTVRQSSEISAVEAMISTSPDRFWALADSLLRDGYLPTESIIVLRTWQDGEQLTVKEGNRRIAVLKLIHGILPTDAFDIPANIAEQIENTSEEWKRANAAVPCTIYDASDASVVDRIVTLAHGKGEKASRDQWNAVARARHNRDAKNVSEPALDLLERYLTEGKNLTVRQAARWAGDYPLTVLAEAIKRLAPRLGHSNGPALVRAYPKLSHRDALEQMMHDIGQDKLSFQTIRDPNRDFAAIYGIPVGGGNGAGKGGNGGSGSGSGFGRSDKSGAGVGGTAGVKIGAKKRKAVSIDDPRAIRRLLKDVNPRGKKREKVVALKEEAMKLDIAKTPLAFCFVLRSMFEISAKAYCDDHAASGGPSLTKGGKERSLAEVLRSITNHLTNNNTNREMARVLHGASTELGKVNGLLSVTSMNQLIHNPRFSIAPGDIAIQFGNIFPLLEAMNS